MKKIIPVAIVCLAVAGCGSSDKKKSSDTAGSGTPPPAAKGGSDGNGGAKVSMKDIKFMPETVTVKADELIQWTNDDPVEHTVTYESGPAKKFDSGPVASGDTYEQTFTKKGTINYICTIHPGQKGKIVVE